MERPSKREHEAGLVSNAGSSGERDNASRYRPGAAKDMVESHFLKANSRDGLRALWIKHTVLGRRGRPAEDVAEVWAVAFARERLAGPVTKRALKRSYPASTAHFSAAPFTTRVQGAAFGHGFARAEIAAAADDGGAAWELRYACPERAFRPFPYARMYEAPFPRSKSLTPVPSSLAAGRFRLAEFDWDVAGFVVTQGHNWGESHAHAYAWTQASQFDGPGDVWFEALTGKVRVGRLTTPWLSVAAISVDGVLHRFDGLRALTARTVHIDARSYTLRLRQNREELRFSISADSDAFAGLRYEDPDGSALACLNSKLACAEVTLTAQGRTRTFKSERAALELGTREPGHGITMLV